MPNEASNNAQDGARPIIWIASYPKSGNTWVRVFLHNLLDELAGTSTTAQNINRLNKHTAWETPAAFEQLIGKPLAEALPREIAQARPLVHAWLASSRPGPFFVKTHLCLGNDHGWPTINLDATQAAIYIVRNPLDVAISFSHHSGVELESVIISLGIRNLKAAVRDQHAYEILGSWSQHVGSWVGLASRPVHLIRYEDMIANPVRTFAQLASFLRLSPTEAELKSAIEKSSFAELSRQESELGFNEKPERAEKFFREGRVGRWREVLSTEQIKRIVRMHAPIMQRFGYLQPDCGASVLGETMD